MIIISHSLHHCSIPYVVKGAGTWLQNQMYLQDWLDSSKIDCHFKLQLTRKDAFWSKTVWTCSFDRSFSTPEADKGLPFWQKY